MNGVRGKYVSLNRLSVGDRFHLGSTPADMAMEWEVVKRFGAKTRVRRLHDDRTPEIQEAPTELMVFVREVEETVEQEVLPISEELENSLRNEQNAEDYDQWYNDFHNGE